MEQHYKFSRKDYDENGFDIFTGLLFTEFIKNCEVAFHQAHAPFLANHLLSGGATMILIKKCMEQYPNYDYGMDLIAGEIDLNANLHIETYSQRSAVYALESAIDDDEPLFLVKDDTISEGIILLRYVSDNDSEESDPNIRTIKDPVGKLY
jgi:hypothetical protein